MDPCRQHVEILTSSLHSCYSDFARSSPRSLSSTEGRCCLGTDSSSCLRFPPSSGTDCCLPLPCGVPRNNKSPQDPTGMCDWDAGRRELPAKQSLWQLRVRSWAPSSPGIFSNHIIHILIKNTLTVNYLRNRIQKPFLFIKNWNIFIKLNTLIINYLRNRMQKPFH